MENPKATELQHEIAGLQLGLDRLTKLEEEYRELRDDSDKHGYEYFEYKRAGIAESIIALRTELTARLTDLNN